MKKSIVFGVGIAFLLLFVANTAFAGVMGTVKGMFSWTVAAFVISGLLAIGIVAKYTPIASKLCLAVGALFTNLGLALADGKVSADELKKAKEDFVKVRELFKPKDK